MCGTRKDRQNYGVLALAISIPLRGICEVIFIFFSSFHFVRVVHPFFLCAIVIFFEAKSIKKEAAVAAVAAVVSNS